MPHHFKLYHQFLTYFSLIVKSKVRYLFSKLHVWIFLYSISLFSHVNVQFLVNFWYKHIAIDLYICINIYVYKLGVITSSIYCACGSLLLGHGFHKGGLGLNPVWPCAMWVPNSLYSLYHSSLQIYVFFPQYCAVRKKWFLFSVYISEIHWLICLSF